MTEFFSAAARRLLLVAVIPAAAFVSVPGAVAGGSFQRIVGVGGNGTWAVIKLEQTGLRSDSVLGGRTVVVPSGGYVRIYPFIGSLPAVPRRLAESASFPFAASSRERRRVARMAVYPLRRWCLARP